MALTRARKVLELVVRDVYERRYNEPPGTRPLENLSNGWSRTAISPTASTPTPRPFASSGNVGTHTFGEKITAAGRLPVAHPADADSRMVLRGRAAGARAGTRTGAADRRRARTVGCVACGSRRQVAVVPKGLRSFDAKDADFFLDLLPGPRDKDGLPESIRFWKHRVEDRPTSRPSRWA